jgi:hypothetical protein
MYQQKINICKYHSYRYVFCEENEINWELRYVGEECVDRFFSSKACVLLELP